MIDPYEHIEEYLRGGLSEEERTAFEKVLKDDTLLQQAIKHHPTVDLVLDYILEKDIRGIIADTSTNNLARSEEPVQNWSKLIVIFMGLLLLGVLVYMSTKSKAPKKSEEIYAAHYTPYIANVSRGDEVEAQTLSLCDQGHQYLNMAQYAEAQSLFEEALSNEYNHCTDKARWYLMMIHLREGHHEVRDSLIQLILDDPKSRYHGKSTELLQSL